jgi:hypothetical protein
MKLNSSRKLALVGILILVVFCAVKGILATKSFDPNLIFWQTLRYLTTPEGIFFGGILIVVFIFSRDEKK